jgi:hypothetical protein
MLAFGFWLVLDLVDLVKLKMGFLNQSCWPSLGCHILDLVGF